MPSAICVGYRSVKTSNSLSDRFSAHDPIFMADKTPDLPHNFYRSVVSSGAHDPILVRVVALCEKHARTYCCIPFTRSKNYLVRDLECNLHRNPEDAPVYKEHSFIVRYNKAYHNCCSLFRHCYIAIHLLYRLKMIQTAIQIECLHGRKFSIQIAICITLLRVDYTTPIFWPDWRWRTHPIRILSHTKRRIKDPFFIVPSFTPIVRVW